MTETAAGGCLRLPVWLTRGGRSAGEVAQIHYDPYKAGVVMSVQAAVCTNSYNLNKPVQRQAVEHSSMQAGQGQV